MVGSCRCSTSKSCSAQPAPGPGVGHRAERHPGHRPVVRHADRPAGRGDELGHRGALVGRGEHARPGARAALSAAASPTTCACTPPGTSSEYGQTMPTRSGRAGHGPRRARRGRRSAVQIGCSTCQSAGAAAISAANASATAWVAAGTSRAAGHRHRRGASGTDQPSGGEAAGRPGSARAPVSAGQPRRAGREPGRLAEQLDLDPGRRSGPGRPAGRPRRRPAAAGSAPGARPGRPRPPPPRSRATPGTPTNRRYSDSGRSRCGHRGERRLPAAPAQRLHQPDPGDVPVAAVRQRERPRRARRRSAREERLGPADVRVHRPRGPPPGPSAAAGTPRTSTARSCAARPGPARPARPATPRAPPGPGWPAAGAAPAPAAAGGQVGAEPERRRAPARRARRDQPPGRRVLGVGQPLSGAVTPRSAPLTALDGAVDRVRRRGRRLPTCGWPPARPRYTSTMRCPTVHTDAAASSHSATVSAYGTPSPSQPGADQRDDQPLGPLDQPAVGGQPDALGPRLDVGDELAGDQADQRGDAEQPLVPDARGTTRPARRTARRRRPGRRWSRAPRRTPWSPPAARAIAPSSRSNSTNTRDHDGADEQLAAGQEPQRPRRPSRRCRRRSPRRARRRGRPATDRSAR